MLYFNEKYRGVESFERFKVTKKDWKERGQVIKMLEGPENPEATWTFFLFLFFEEEEFQNSGG